MAKPHHRKENPTAGVAFSLRGVAKATQSKHTAPAVRSREKLGGGIFADSDPVRAMLCIALLCIDKIEGRAAGSVEYGGTGYR